MRSWAIRWLAATVAIGFALWAVGDHAFAVAGDTPLEAAAFAAGAIVGTVLSWILLGSVVTVPLAGIVWLVRNRTRRG